MTQPKTIFISLLPLMLGGCLGLGSGDSVDTEKPVISVVTAPASDVALKVARIQLAGSVSDNRQLQSLQLDLNGSLQPIAVTGGRFSTTLDLQAGDNSYRLLARDAAGNEAVYGGSYQLGSRVAAANAHSGAIRHDQFYAWGRNNYAQTGLGTVTTLAANPAEHPVSPQKVATPAVFVALAFNQNFSLAIDKAGQVYGWGDDSYGQLGRGSNGQDVCGTSLKCRKSIGRIEGLPAAVSIAAGYNHALALDKQGNVYTFGRNQAGQLGNASTVDSSVPVAVQWPEALQAQKGRIVQVIAASSSSYALDDKGQLWGWGSNSYGNLGQGVTSASQTTPLLVPMPVGVRIVEAAAGRDHVLALTDSGQVYAWGLNASSQVGFNGYQHKGQATAWEGNVLSPRLLPHFNSQKAVAVYANANTSYYRNASGQLLAWGMYGVTEGTGTVYANLDEPENRLPTLSGISDLVVGALHQVAFRQQKDLFSWGWSFEGSLGGGATTTNVWMYNVPLALRLP